LGINGFRPVPKVSSELTLTGLIVFPILFIKIV